MQTATQLPDPLDAAIAAASRRHELLMLIRQRRERALHLHKLYVEAQDLMGAAQQELANFDQAGRAVR